MSLTAIISLLSLIYFPTREVFGYFARKKAADLNYKKGWDAAFAQMNQAGLDSLKSAKETADEISKLSDSDLRKLGADGVLPKERSDTTH